MVGHASEVEASRQASLLNPDGWVAKIEPDLPAAMVPASLRLLARLDFGSLAMPQKFAIVIPDGAADEPLASLGGRTPLQAAHIPEMDAIAREGVLGRSRNVPDCFLPGSDVATLSLFGYDPEVVFTGRAPLEAAAAGVELGPSDWAIRCNLMNSRDGCLTDFTAEHISSVEARALIDALEAKFGCDEVEFHPGVSYRNLMIYRGDKGRPAPFDASTRTVPPHDHPDQPLDAYLPQGGGADLLRELIEDGSPLVAGHPVNLIRAARGFGPPTSFGCGARVRRLDCPSSRWSTD